jgi:ceramide glucosyltransferase
VSPLAAAVGVLTVVSWVYWLVALAAVRRHRAARPLAPGALPAVSILKPVRGLDAGALESFASFCRQRYPALELVFGVADAADPAVATIDGLRRAFPDVPIRVVVAPSRAPNRKAAILDALARAARHDVLVATDADMRVASGWLEAVVSALVRPGVGLVTCPYRGAGASSLAARLEALYMGVTFLPSTVVAAELLGVAFAVGSTMALRRADLERIGGFAALADQLADDYELGARVAALGHEVALCPEVVESVLGAPTLRETWDREVRWSRCARAGRPAGHLGYAVTFAVPLAMFFLLATRLGPIGWAVLATSMAVRAGVALGVALATEDVESLRALWLLPARDVLTAAVWAAALVGRRVVWRGEVFDVDHAGRLRGVAKPWQPAAPGEVASRAGPVGARRALASRLDG